MTGKGLLLDFGGVLTSSLYGRMAEFCVEAAKLGLAPADCVFVDDTFANVITAREVSLAAVHFTGEAEELAEVERLLGLA